MGAIDRLVSKKGTAATLFTYTAGAADAYEDPAWTEDAGTAITVLVEIPTRGASPSVPTVGGEEVQVDAILHALSTVTVSPDGEDPAAGSDRPPEIDVTGQKRYVVRANDVNTVDGAQRLLCTEVR